MELILRAIRSPHPLSSDKKPPWLYSSVGATVVRRSLPDAVSIVADGGSGKGVFGGGVSWGEIGACG